ncbi:MAG: hypothetical protein CM1200mP27_09920 [Chloroflexota bacterium]|nr:MAG: hypothetical protein CM1200mP27_09920 [Chloroflexota bacterium]
MEKLSPGDIGIRYPNWNSNYYISGYFNPRAGWAEAGKIIARLVQDAMNAGNFGWSLVFQLPSCFRRLKRVSGGFFHGRRELRADFVVVAAGVWTTELLPNLADRMWPVGQPIFYFKPIDVDSYRPPLFPPWGADIPRSGWYGFPVNPDGVVKLANHGPGGESMERGTDYLSEGSGQL